MALFLYSFSIIVERWLPYKQQKRRVIYQKAPPVQAPAPQKNLIIQWEGTQARVVKEFRNLGIIKADPNTYVQQYGPQLRPTQGLPDFVKGLPTPNLGPEYVRIFIHYFEIENSILLFVCIDSRC
jgi:hypothetical protein